MRRNSYTQHRERTSIRISFLKRMDFPDHNHRVNGFLKEFIGNRQVRVADEHGRTFIIHEDDFDYV